MKNLKGFFIRLFTKYFAKNRQISRAYLDLFGTILIFIGMFAGSYLTATKLIIPKLFASTSPWTQTDWSGGQSDSLATGTVTTYKSITGLDATTTPGQFSLNLTSDWSADYSSWQYRKKVTFNNTDANLGVTSEALTDFPVLIKLDKDTDIDYAKTKAAGADLRFTDSDGTVLSYEIEKWDPTASSYIWVKVPQIDINSNTDYIYMYYGNTGASDGQSAISVWDSNYVMVQHLKESSGIHYDSTSRGNNGTTTGTMSQGVLGLVGSADSFTDGYVQFGSSSDFDQTGEVTYDMWVWVKSPVTGNSYHCFIGQNYSYVLWFGMYGTTQKMQVWLDGVCYGACTAGTWPDITLDTWHHVAVTAKTGSGNTKMWIDGVQYGPSITVSSDLVSSSTDNMQIGKDVTGYPFQGNIDEVRISKSARSAAWIAATYKSGTDAFNTFDTEASKYPTTGNIVSNIFDAGYPADWGILTFTSSGTGTVTVKVRSSNSSTMDGATDWASCSGISSGADLTGGCVTDGQRYLQYQVTLTPSGGNTPIFSDISVAFTASDQIQPNVNASSIAMSTAASGGRSVSGGGWNSGTTPYFSWTAGSDNVTNTSGVKGYCLYLGTTVDADPGNSVTHSGTSGLLTNSPVSVSGTYCGFIVSGTNLNLASGSYLSSALVSGSTYYLRVKIIDNAGNTYDGTAASFSFVHDSTPPTNVSYISTPGSTYSNVTDMFFTWPTSGGTGASDANSDVLGYQYQIGGTDGVWKGTSTSTTCSLDYIPAATGTYTLTQGTDGGSISVGSNVVYFRTVDNACNPSSSSTYRTGSLLYGGQAPYFGGGDTATVTPSTSTSNSFALSWPAATAAAGKTVTHYYYMVNTTPPSTLDTLQGNTSTYIDNSTTRTVAAAALPNINKGTNTIYVVAIDNATTPNYSPSNYITGTFTLNSTDPDNVGNLVSSDSSIKSSSQWNVTLTWTAPTYQGAGNLTYLIKRSTDNSTFTQTGTTSGLSYVDNTPSSTLYYYKVYTKDGANATSSGTNATSITPTGKWTSAPTLDSEPTVSAITTKKATITWGTSRASDSKVAFGTSSGSYGSDEVSNSTQTSSHTVNLTNLKAGTTYYYKAKWTDEDGNTGESGEKTFTTTAAPSVKNVTAKSIGLTNAIIQYTVSNANSVKIYYGSTTSFGGLTTVSTSTSETTYTTELSGLSDGVKYYYKINTLDSESAEYDNQINDFTTLPRPKVSSVRIQQVVGTAQPTVLISWTTNTEISSIVTYYPEGDTSQAHDEVNVALTKGEHKMIIRGLSPQTGYTLVVKGRDKIGNEAISDSQRFTTATDTRPPQISDLKVEGSNLPTTSNSNSEQNSQLIVSWNTDEPGTSQVEFGEGTGTTYAQKTQQDSNLTFNHLVVISGLTPSKVYHLRALSQDKANNLGNSIDNVTITPKATENALNLVITNLQEAFGFLGGLKQ